MAYQAGKLLTRPVPQGNPLSVRAQAVVFADPKSQALLEQIERVAPSEATVLIIGETGTGKELVAKHIHEQSKRSGPFVAVNCGALSETLAEAELFGHQAGAFTGANETRPGWFEVANGGTLFLDEIGDLPLTLQVKLLRVLQEREVVRVGSRKPIPLDIRLVAATNIDLANAVTAGNFRLDLYYRLNVATLDLAPLRNRRGDILPLVDYFLRIHSQRLQIDLPVLLPETKVELLNYSWPGNIRELENVVHFALIISGNGVIKPENLRFPARPQSLKINTASPLESIATQLDRLFEKPPAELFDMLEDIIIRRAFDHCKNNQVQTARLLGISRNILRTQLKRFGLLSSESDSAELAAINV